MQDDHKERRFVDATSLQDSIDALAKVPLDQRRGFLHDRLMSHIDGICKNHGAGGKNCFTNAQIHAIKDVCFILMDILDPKSKRPKGFVPALLAEFKEKTAMGQLASLGAVVVFLFSLIGGTVAAYEKVIRPSLAYEAPRSTAVEAQPNQSKNLDILRITPTPLNPTTR